MDYIAIGDRIKKARIRSGYTQHELSCIAGISTSYLGHIERGTRVMSVATLFSLSSSLGLSCDYVLTGKPYKKPTF